MAPDFTIFQSCVAQLEYLAGVVEGRDLDRGRLREMTIGVYAAKEFEASDPDFASALFAAFAIADRMSRGLKP